MKQQAGHHSTLLLELLGTPQITLGGQPMTGFVSIKAKALLIYLAETGRPHARAELETLLWGGEATRARNNLRKVLGNLNQLLGPYVEVVRRDPVRLHLNMCRVDATSFEQLTSANADVSQLEQGIQLYRDTFLSGFDVRRADGFEEWLRGRRAHYRTLMIAALRTLADHCATAGQLARAIELTRRILELEELSEETHRQLMLLLARNGELNAAQQQYELCRKVLHEEVGSSPSAETNELYMRILEGEFDPPHAEIPATVRSEVSETDKQRSPTNLPLATMSLPLSQPPEPGPLPPGSVMPLSRNPLFVGRTLDLQELARALDSSSAAAVSQIETAAATGLGGIGKTQLACEFVHRYGRFFPGGVFWMSFDSAEAVPAEVAACGGAGALELRADFGNLPISDQVRLVEAAWRNTIPRLLIFDNCEDPGLLARWRPSSGGCRVLVTSRRGDWERVLGVSMLALGVLNRHESVSLLQKHCETADQTILDEIAEELGDLPLALHLAGSYLYRYRLSVTPAQYLAELRNPSLLEHPSLKGGGISPTGHEQHVGRTFALSYDKLDLDDERDQLAHKLLIHTAHFAPGEPIWYELLVRTLALDPEQPAEAVRANDAFERLIELGIIRAEEDTLRMHRLVAAFVRHVAADAVEASQQAVEEVVYAETSRINKAVHPLPLLAWQTHLRSVVDVAQTREDEESARLCTELGTHLWQIGDYQGALPYHEKALSIRERILGESHHATAESLINVGRVLRALGRSAETKVLFERALRIRMECYGKKHLDTAESLENLGRCLHEMGDPAAALQIIEEALEIVQELIGNENELAAEYYNNIAYCKFDLGDADGALSSYKQALNINESVLGPDHPHSALNNHNIGSVLRYMARFAEAQPFVERALDIWRNAYGDEHTDTMIALNSKAALLCEMGKLSSALPMAEQSLKRFVTILGEDHVRTSYGHRVIGLIFQKLGESEQAKQHLQRALDIRERSLGSQHYLTEEIYRDLQLFELKDSRVN